MRAPICDPVSLPPGRAALLLIDLQEEQRSDPDYAAHEFASVLSNCRQLLDAARANQWPVAHAQYVRDFSVEPPRAFEAVSADGGATFSDARSGQIALCVEVEPKSGEPVFVKNDASAFRGTQIASWLADHRVEWLLIGGVWTEACVAATVRDAISNGFRVLLVKDACGSGSQLMHQTAMLNLANRLSGGGICDTARAVALLGGDASTVWRMVDPVPFRFTADSLSDLYDGL